VKVVCNRIRKYFRAEKEVGFKTVILVKQARPLFRGTQDDVSSLGF